MALSPTGNAEFATVLRVDRALACGFLRSPSKLRTETRHTPC